MKIIRINFKDVNISFYQAFIMIIVVELYYSLLIASNEVIVKDLKVFR